MQDVRRVLVVDDEENARIGLSRLLTQEGYEVDCALDGEDALGAVARCRPHLVITDINMPRMDGLSLLKELNKDYPGVGVIMITAFGGVESYLDAMNLGAFEYLNKPVKLHELRSVMQKIFGQCQNLQD